MIFLMALLLRAFVSPRLEARAREHAHAADSGHAADVADTRVLATWFRGARVYSRPAQP